MVSVHPSTIILIYFDRLYKVFFPSFSLIFSKIFSLLTFFSVLSLCSWSRRGGGAVGLGFGVGFSSRGSPVCRGFEVGLGFWSQRGGGAVGLGFGVGSSSRGSPVCRGFEVGLGFWISARWWAVGLSWVFGFVCRGVAVGFGRAQRRRK